MRLGVVRHLKRLQLRIEFGGGVDGPLIHVEFLGYQVRLVTLPIQRSGDVDVSQLGEDTFFAQ